MLNIVFPAVRPPSVQNCTKSQVMISLIIMMEPQTGSEHDHERLSNSKGLGIYIKYIHIKPTNLFYLKTSSASLQL
jgi:hypothetical protein